MARALPLLLLSAVLLWASSAYAWRELAPGLEFRTETGGVQAFRIDLKRLRLRGVQAKAPGRTAATVSQLTTDTTLVAVNGGYFNKQNRPLGLLIDQGQVTNPLRRADWGVLTVSKAGRARLVHTRDYKPDKSTDFAIQAGPRLVVKGAPLTFPAQAARRTALGIEPNGRYLILVVASQPMLTARLATLMHTTFGCDFALNLDGGSSTQLWAKDRGVKRVRGISVANAVLVTPR